MSLRILTWNVQMITAVELLDGFGPVSDDEAQLRAFRAAAAIRAMPPMQRPDVVAFNEVFNEVGRRTLLDELRPDYPHQVDKIDFVNDGCYCTGIQVYRSHVYNPSIDMLPKASWSSPKASASA